MKAIKTVLPLKYAVIAAIVLLTACSTPKNTMESPVLQKPQESTTTAPKTDLPTEPMATASHANQLSTWELSGAIAAKHRNKGWTASLNWQQQGPNQYQIRLFGPLGGGTVVIEKHNGIITYRDGPKIITAKNAEDLLEKQAGIRLPVQNLYYWVRGIPAPGGTQTEQRDETHHLTVLKQSGYTIDYTGYTRVSELDLPNKIRLQGHGVAIKLIIKHWRI